MPVVLTEPPSGATTQTVTVQSKRKSTELRDLHADRSLHATVVTQLADIETAERRGELKE